MMSGAIGSPVSMSDESMTNSPTLPYMPGMSPRLGNTLSKAYKPSHSVSSSPLIGGAEDDLPAELTPVFSFLNIHSQKVFVEGYLLKLNDLLPDGKPCPDRRWVEYYGQLSGAVLSLWDAAALDLTAETQGVPGQPTNNPGDTNGDNVVLPTFLNVTDAKIRMLGTLPSKNSPPLQNILSITTAGQNRYLFQFSSMHNLTLWTAGLKLALFEYASLQESYTGALIAGFGKSVNNIRHILTESRLKTEGWVRVRFAPGTSWQKYWAVCSPPEKKKKKKDLTTLGEIALYENKKVKKYPFVTVTDVYAAYAVYPQARALIENSSLLKIHGKIKRDDISGEGYIFFMPEVNPMVRGLEILLAWLVPIYDAFALYGRPKKFASDPSDPASLFFGMPRERGQYGSLDIEDVMGHVASEGGKSDMVWRQEIREMIATRMQKSLQRSSLPQQTRSLKWGDTDLPESPEPPIGRVDDEQQVQEPQSSRRQRSVSESSAIFKGKVMAGMRRSFDAGKEAARRSTSATGFGLKPLPRAPIEEDETPLPPPHRINGMYPGRRSSSDTSFAGAKPLPHAPYDDENFPFAPPPQQNYGSHDADRMQSNSPGPRMQSNSPMPQMRSDSPVPQMPMEEPNAVFISS